LKSSKAIELKLLTRDERIALPVPTVRLGEKVWVNQTWDDQKGHFERPILRV